MADQTSDYYTNNNKLGTRKGRPTAGDITWGMFPDKLDRTDMIEDPFQIEELHRTTLSDFTPDAPTFEHEKPRRNTFSREKLNLREGGARTLTDPYRNDDYDLQFYDKDPRGWSEEQPWSEFNRQATARISQLDFKDDNDYSVPSQGIHPNTMNYNIRGAQNWLKSRLKIFETSYENLNMGGVGVYPDVSKKYHSNTEDSTVNSDVLDYDGEVIPTFKGFNISNYLHNGSKYFEATTTTDHKVPVASYGKLYANRGLIPHETQMRMIQDDTKFLTSKSDANKRLKHIMEMNTSQHTIYDSSKYNGIKGHTLTESQGKTMRMTRDIMSLMGFTENDVKYLRQIEQINPKKANQMLAQLADLTITVHKLPHQAQLELRSELIRMKTPAYNNNMTASLSRSLIDNKIARQLKAITNSRNTEYNNNDKRQSSTSNKVRLDFKNNTIYKGTPFGENKSSVNSSIIMVDGIEKRIQNYSNMPPIKPLDNYNGSHTHDIQDIIVNHINKSAELANEIKYNKNNYDNEFGENLTKDRRMGMGTKYLVGESFVDVDDNPLNDK